MSHPASGFGFEIHSEVSPSFVPKIHMITQKDPQFSLSFAESLIKLRPDLLKVDPTGATALADITQSLLQKLVAYAKLDIEDWPRYSSSNVGNEGIKLVRLCFEGGAQVCIPSLLGRMLRPKSTTVISKQLKELIKFLTQLRNHLATVTLDLSVEPFSSFTAEVLVGYVAEVLGPEPPEVASRTELLSVGCGCSDCEGLYKFFSTFTEESVSIHTKGPSEDGHAHLVDRLKVAKDWGVSVEIVGSTIKACRFVS